MYTPPVRPARKAFTLVELVTAASLMTVMMLGVVEIFGIVAQTAGDAEGIHFAQQQMRALFDRLHKDIRGMTREGYLTIEKGMVFPSGRGRSVTYDHSPESAAPPDRNYPQRYGADTLAFVTVGPCQSQMNDTPREAASAEVVYTNYVMTDGQEVLRVGDTNVTPRRGILARGLWLLAGTGTSTSLWGSQSQHQYLCHLFADENETLQAQQGGRGSATPPPPRIIASGGAADGALHVDPWLTEEAATTSSHPESLNRVMACCVSEFYVEAYVSSSAATSSNYFQADNDAALTYRWSQVYDASGEAIKYDTGEPIETWPQAIRVTVAIHDPGDSGEIPEGQNRFQGYAMQETFWLGDP